MRGHRGPILWFIIGGVIGFSTLALVGFGAITVLPAVFFAALLLVRRVPGSAMALVGAGSVISVTWSLHITSGDTPDSELWPVFLGFGLVAAGLTMFYMRNRVKPARP